MLESFLKPFFESWFESFFAWGNDSNLLVYSTYDPTLLVFSVLIAITFSALGLHIAEVSRYWNAALSRQLALTSGALALGVGVWSMHFVGMLALNLCAPVKYDLTITLISILPGVLACVVALRLLVRDTVSRRRLLLSGVLVGGGIGMMHYLGMQAMRMTPLLRYDPLWFAISIVVAVLLAVLALWIYTSPLARGLVGWQRLWLSASVMGSAIAGMHYTAMNATLFIGSATTPTPIPSTDSDTLLIVIGLGIFVFSTFVFIANTAHLRERATLAESASRAKSEFLSSMSHELRTPLNAILGYAQLISLESNLPRQVLDRVHEIENAGQILLMMINDIIDLSRIEANKLNLSIEPVNVASVVTESISIVEQACKMQAITVVNQSCPLSVVQADYFRLRQVLINLLTNAIKYNRPNGSVTVTCLEHAQHMRINIMDTGLGIAADKQSRIFHTFDRLGMERGKIEGSGIGLVISKHLVEAMNGTIGFESTEGQGSTFWINLPMGNQTEPISVDKHSENIQAAQPTAAGAPQRILLADDNPVNQRLALQVLTRFGYHTDTVENGAEAVTAATQQHYDLVLMDCQMPQMDGYEATAAIRKMELDRGQRRLPIIAMTANVMSGDREKCLAAGMDDYIAKPINVHNLRDKLTQWMEEQNSP